MSKRIIVVATDFSEGAEIALDHARMLATHSPGAEVHVLHVMPPFVGPSSFEPFVLATGGPVLGQALAAAQAQLETTCRSETLTMKWHVRVGPPAHEIVAFAREMEADTLVLGTHGRRGMERLLLGSVAEHVVRTAPCTVLVARAKEVPAGATIEPPCADCVATREVTDNAQAWCARHSHHHPHGHTYAGKTVGSGYARPPFGAGGTG